MSISSWESGWLRLSNLSLTVRVGKTTKKFDASQQGFGTEFIVSEVLEEIKDSVDAATKVNLNKLAKNMPKVVENSYVNAVSYAARSMIGTLSPRGATERSQPVEILDPERDLTLTYWQALAPRTIREQNQIRNEKGPGRFYMQTGTLKAELLSMARSMVKRTGVVRVSYKGALRDARGRFASLATTKKQVKLGEFVITLMPNINRAAIPGMISGRASDTDKDLTFERKLGLSPDAIRKLKGASKGSFVIPGTHRPLLQPVFTYWTLNRIPQVIARSIQTSIDRRVINDSSGLASGTIVR